MSYRRSRFHVGERVVLVKDWDQVAKSGELKGEVVGFNIADGRAIVQTEPRVTHVAPNDNFWRLESAPHETGSLF